MKTKRINVRIAENEKKELTEISLQLDIPESIIVREAVKEKISQLKNQSNNDLTVALQP